MIMSLILYILLLFEMLNGSFTDCIILSLPPVGHLAYFSPLRERFPIINRCLSLLLSWAIVNLAIVGGMTFIMVRFASIRSGVPIFP